MSIPKNWHSSSKNEELYNINTYYNNLARKTQYAKKNICNKRFFVF